MYYHLKVTRKMLESWERSWLKISFELFKIVHFQAHFHVDRINSAPISNWNSEFLSLKWTILE